MQRSHYDSNTSCSEPEYKYIASKSENKFKNCFKPSPPDCPATELTNQYEFMTMI